MHPVKKRDGIFWKVREALYKKEKYGE